MLLHTPTLMLVSQLIAVAMGISMGLVARRERHDGLVWWAWAMVPLVLTLILFSLRGQVSDWYSVVLGNTFLIAVLALFAEGLCEFQQRQPKRAMIWGAVVGTPVLIVLFMDVPKVRPLLANVALGLQAALLLWLVLERRRQTTGRGQYFVAAGLALIVVATLLRLGAAIWNGADLNQVTSSDVPHALSMLVFLLTIVLTTMGLVLMTKERADELNRSLAMYDELTGLNNRRYIEQTMVQHVAQAKRSQRPLSMLILDIDHFKRVNDTHGHLAGDKVLHDVAACIQERLREQDIMGRWGGEEFIALLPDTDAPGAMTLAERLRSAVEQARFTTPEGRGIPLTISIGVHTLLASNPDGRHDLVGRADRALYRAKKQGRNQVVAL